MPRTSKRAAAAAAAADADVGAEPVTQPMADPSVPTSPAAAARPRKRRRQPLTWSQFVLAHYHVPEVERAPVRDRLRILGRLWEAHRAA